MTAMSTPQLALGCRYKLQTEMEKLGPIHVGYLFLATAGC